MSACRCRGVFSVLFLKIISIIIKKKQIVPQLFFAMKNNRINLSEKNEVHCDASFTFKE